MPRLVSLLALICAISFSSACHLSSASEMAPMNAEGFTPLFNGRDLTGWIKTADDPGWRVEDGTLVLSPIKGKPMAYLYTEKQYSDFILQVEYQVKKQGANSGVFFRCNKPANFPASGFEVQVLGDYGQEPTLGSAGALYGTIIAPKNYSNPIGEWNRYTIIVIDRDIIVFMNGNLLYQMNMDDPAINEAVANSPRKDLVPRERTHRAGHIGLQNHSDWVAFRNIRIKELPHSVETRSEINEP